MPAETCHLSSAVLQMSSLQNGSSGKTSPASCPPTTTHSDAFWLDLPAKLCRSSRQGDGGRTLVMCLDHRGISRGDALMPNTSVWPNDASGCSLLRVLETGPIPDKYFLSAKACWGIIRRAAKRKRILPTALLDALVSVVFGSRLRRLRGVFLAHARRGWIIPFRSIPSPVLRVRSRLRRAARQPKKSNTPLLGNR